MLCAPCTHVAIHLLKFPQWQGSGAADDCDEQRRTAHEDEDGSEQRAKIRAAEEMIRAAEAQAQAGDGEGAGACGCAVLARLVL